MQIKRLSVSVSDINESGGLIHSYQTPVLSFRLPACYWLNYRTESDIKVRVLEIDLAGDKS